MTYLSAFILGFLGSFHCVAMCGAIAIRMNSSISSVALRRQVLYHSGRVISYASIAALLSSFSVFGKLSGGQNIVSIIIGSVLFVISILMLVDVVSADRLTAQTGTILSRMRSSLLRQQTSNAVVPSLVVGLINGFLPCGFVYMALAAALMQSTTLDSMLFMSLFGLGTVPSLAALLIVTRLPRLHTWFNSRRAVTFGTALAGLLLVIRGLALGIPYLSPSLPINVQTLSDIKHEQVCGSPRTP